MMRYLSPAKAAEAMNFSPWTLRRMIREEKVPGFRLGNRFLVDTVLFAQKLEEDSRASMKQ